MIRAARYAQHESGEPGYHSGEMNLQASIVVAGCALFVSCEARAPEACDRPEVRRVVERFGERLQRVSLLAPDSVVVREMRDAYTPFLTAELLDTWTSNPRRAPGREVSSPWPERIDVRAVQPTDAGGCRVEAEVVYASSEPAAGDSAMRQWVTFVLRDADGWRIASYTPTSQPSAPSDATEAADVLRRYYAAIDAGDYRRAYSLWENGGAASNRTYEEFVAGFADTRSTQIDIGAPGRVEGAAGSRHVEINVIIRAVTRRGENQRFEGTYVLRRSVVDGASPEQQRWRISRATLEAVP